MSAIRRFRRDNVDPRTGNKIRKGHDGGTVQLIHISGSLNNRCVPYITKTIHHNSK